MVVLRRIGRKDSSDFLVGILIALYLAIGPFFAIPRTATVSYNIGVSTVSTS